MFDVALLPSIVSLELLPLRDVLILATIVIAVVGAILAAYVLLAARIRRYIQSSRALRRVNRGSAVVMAGAAGVMAAR